MVLRLKTRESRSLPGLQNATYVKQSSHSHPTAQAVTKGPLTKRPFVLQYISKSHGFALARGGAAR